MVDPRSEIYFQFYKNLPGVGPRSENEGSWWRSRQPAAELSAFL